MNKKSCPNCGVNYLFLIEKSRLGCSFCYVAFYDEVIWHLKKLQNGKTQHKGKHPLRFDDPADAFVIKCINDSFEGDYDKENLKMKCGLTEG